MGFFGWTFLVIFLAFIIYLFGGMLVMKYKGATGLQLIPNLNFWISVAMKTKV